MRPTPSFRSFPNDTFETVPMFQTITVPMNTVLYANDNSSTQTTTVQHKRQQYNTNDNSSTQTTTVQHKRQQYTTNDNSTPQTPTQTTTVVHKRQRKRQQYYTNDNSFVSVAVRGQGNAPTPYTRNWFRPQSIGIRHVIKTLRPHKRKGIPRRMEPISIGGPPGLYKLD